MLHCYMVSLGQNIYLWRIFKGLSQEALAKKAHIPRPNLTTIENNKRDLSVPTLRAIAAGLDIDPGTLINGISPMSFKNHPISRKSQELIIQASLGKSAVHITHRQKELSAWISGIVKNKLNARDKVSKNTFKERRSYIKNWLILKASLPHLELNSLLARLDKQIERR